MDPHNDLQLIELIDRIATTAVPLALREDAFKRLGNLQVFEVPAETSAKLAGLASRNMQLQVLVQEGLVQVMDAAATVEFEITALQGAD